MNEQFASLGRAVLEAALYARGFLKGPSTKPAVTGRPRIAFQTFSVHLAQFFKPVIEELRGRDEVPEIHFIVLPHPHLARSTWSEVAAYSRDELGIPAGNVRFWWDAAWDRFDAVVYGDSYAKFPHRSGANILLYHGPAVQRRDFTRGPWRKSSADFHAVVVAGPYDKNQFEVHGNGTQNAHVLGFPFLDSLVGGLPVSRERYFAKLGLDPERRTILFGPHWKVLDLASERGVNYFEDVLKTLSESECNVVMKLHAFSLVRASRERQWRERIMRLQSTVRLAVDRDIDDRPALKYCDLLVTDTSSRAFCFMLLGKPVVMYQPVDLVSDECSARRIALITKGSWPVSSPEELRRCVSRLEHEQVVNTPGLEVARECFVNPGGSAAKVVDMLLHKVARVHARQEAPVPQVTLSSSRSR